MNPALSSRLHRNSFTGNQYPEAQEIRRVHTLRHGTTGFVITTAQTALPFSFVSICRFLVPSAAPLSLSVSAIGSSIPRLRKHDDPSDSEPDSKLAAAAGKCVGVRVCTCVCVTSITSLSPLSPCSSFRPAEAEADSDCAEALAHYTPACWCEQRERNRVSGPLVVCHTSHHLSGLLCAPPQCCACVWYFRTCVCATAFLGFWMCASLSICSCCCISLSVCWTGCHCRGLSLCLGVNAFVYPCMYVCGVLCMRAQVEDSSLLSRCSPEEQFTW